MEHATYYYYVFVEYIPFKISFLSAIDDRLRHITFLFLFFIFARDEKEEEKYIKKVCDALNRNSKHTKTNELYLGKFIIFAHIFTNMQTQFLFLYFVGVLSIVN